MRVANLGGNIVSLIRLCATHTASGLAISHYYREAA